MLFAGVVVAGVVVGAGDVKLAGFIGLVVGFPQILAALLVGGNRARGRRGATGGSGACPSIRCSTFPPGS